MRRAAIAAVLLTACVAAGLLLAVVAAGPGGAVPYDSTTTTTSTTVPADTPIAQGVTVGGVPVGGLTPSEAYSAVRLAFEKPLAVVVAGHRYAPSPEDLGATAYALRAIDRARVAPPGTAIPLQISVKGQRVRAYVAALAERTDRPAVDARLVLRNLRPWISHERTGRVLDRLGSTRALLATLVANKKGPLTLPVKVRKANVTRRAFGPVIVIRRGENRLYIYRGMSLWRTFGVATGQTAYPTPLGRFTIVVKWRNPWWYPPNSAWAAGQSPIPPGPGNPLGTRWMGLSASGVGIHGTYSDGSIGYSVSHGCIRMHIPDAEWLFNHVSIGTTVFIVAP
jgi:lipoprotein-anchoring transpeptidase ErfK/SrfK